MTAKDMFHSMSGVCIATCGMFLSPSQSPKADAAPSKGASVILNKRHAQDADPRRPCSPLIALSVQEQ